MERRIFNLRWLGLIGGLGLYFAGVGALDAILAQGLGFDHERAGLLNQYEAAVRKSHSSLAQAEPAVPARRKADAAPWITRLGNTAGALEKGNAGGADRACGAGAGFGEF